MRFKKNILWLSSPKMPNIVTWGLKVDITLVKTVHYSEKGAQSHCDVFSQRGVEMIHR